MLLKKFAPKSIESIAQAIEKDQASFVGDIDNAQAVYVDSQKEERHERGEVTEFEEVDTETGEIKQDEPNQENKSDLEF
jgi:hypothetical protein